MKTFSLKASLLTLLLVVFSNNVLCQNNSDGDDRMKIRLGFTSSNNIHRQILVTEDSNTTEGVDFGYDAENFENHTEDMYWMIENRKFLIQGTNAINETTILPLGLHTDTNGNNIISIEDLINVPEDLEIVILDKQTNTYYNIKETSSVSIHLTAGEYLNRFELIFENNNEEDSSSNEDTSEDISNEEEVEDVVEEIVVIEDIVENITYTEVDTKEKVIELNYINRIKSISIKNIGQQTIKSVNIYSITGQHISEFNNINAVDQTLIKAYNLNAGNYILILTSDLGRITKKVSVR